MIELNKIYNVDAFKAIKRLIELNFKVDMIITDPPYGIEYQSNWGRDGEKLEKIENDNDLEWFQSFSDDCYKLLKDNSAFYCFTRYDVYPIMYNCLLKAGFTIKNLLVLQKGQKGGNGDLQAQYSNDCELMIYASKGRRKFNETKLCKTDGRKGSKEYRTRLSNVWFDTEYNKYPVATVNVSNQKQKIVHPTEKNVELIEWYLQISSNENDIILDPFMGSGTTAIACKNTNRRFIGFEVVEKYFYLATTRIENYIDKSKLPC